MRGLNSADNTAGRISSCLVFRALLISVFMEIYLLFSV